jgi:hypothetical protein
MASSFRENRANTYGAHVKIASRGTGIWINHEYLWVSAKQSI